MNSVSTEYALIQGGAKQADSGREAPKKMSGEEFQHFLGALKKHLETRPAPPADSAAEDEAMQVSAAFRAQQIAQTADDEDSDRVSAAGQKVADGKSDAVEAFLEYMAKTPEERYFEAFLNSKGMTEEQFQALPPGEKQAMVKEFEDYVKQHVGEASAERLARAAGAGLF